MGAAIAQVSASITKAVILGERDKMEVLKEISDEVSEMARQKGAVEGTITTIPDITPLGYIRQKGFMYAVKAIGNLDIDKLDET